MRTLMAQAPQADVGVRQRFQTLRRLCEQSVFILKISNFGPIFRNFATVGSKIFKNLLEIRNVSHSKFFNNLINKILFVGGLGGVDVILNSLREMRSHRHAFSFSISNNLCLKST